MVSGGGGAVLTVMALINYFAHRDERSRAQDHTLHALAFSTYWHARLRVSPGDDPSGLSLRAWLARIGVELHEGAAVKNLLSGVDETPTPLSLRGWLDAVPSAVPAPAGAPVATPSTPRMVLRRSSEVARMAPKRSHSSAGTDIYAQERGAVLDELWVDDLRPFGWTVTRGYRVIACVCPVGTLAATELVQHETRVHLDTSGVGIVPEPGDVGASPEPKLQTIRIATRC